MSGNWPTPRSCGPGGRRAGNRGFNVSEASNQRSRLTVRLIREALLRLLEREDFDRITVSAICEEAEINRSTFYRYFDNQFQLLEAIERELIDELESHGTEASYLDTSDEARRLVYETQVDFFRCIEARMDLYRVLVTRVHPNIFEKSHAMRAEAMMRALEPALGRARAAYVSDYVTAGGQKVVAAWIRKGRDRETPEEMADAILDMVYGSLGQTRGL